MILSVNDSNILVLYKPIRERQGCDTDKGARRRLSAREEGSTRFANGGSSFGPVVHDVYPGYAASLLRNSRLLQIGKTLEPGSANHDIKVLILQRPDAATV